MKRVKGQPFPLGVSEYGGNVNFAVAVPKGEKAKLLLYKAVGEKPEKEIELETVIGEVQSIALEDMDRSLRFYNYQFGEKIVIDPYVKSLAGRSFWGEGKDAAKHEAAGEIYAEAFDWEDDQLLKIPYEDVIAYSLHVRGFSMDKYSDVSAKGTFEGIIEKIPYFKDLGINQIQCMPVYEFEECTEPTNYWGYGPAYYFAPKSAYSAIGDGVKSFKNMVKALHKEGIELVLEMPFDVNVPKQMMTDCLRYYVMEYHIDGFICNHVISVMDSLWSDPYLKEVKILNHRTTFKDTMRCFLKGDKGQVWFAIQCLHQLANAEKSMNYITSHSGFTLNDLVSYNEKHNEVNGEHNKDGADFNNSWNCGYEGPSQYDEVVALRKNQMRNAMMFTLLSQGTPCILAGDEWANTQFGNNNVYCQDNEFGWLLWERFPYNHDLFEFVKEIITLRKSYKVFHPKEKFTGRDMKNCGIPDVSYHGSEAWCADFSEESRELGVYYHDEIAGEDVYVAYNMHWEEKTFALPKLYKNKKWYLKASTKTGVIADEKLLNDQQRQVIEPRSIVVFAGKGLNEA